MCTIFEFRWNDGYRIYKLCIKCDISHPSVSVEENKIIAFDGQYPRIDKKNTDKDFEEVFSIVERSMYHTKIDFKKRPQKITIFFEGMCESDYQKVVVFGS